MSIDSCFFSLNLCEKYLLHRVFTLLFQPLYLYLQLKCLAIICSKDIWILACQNNKGINRKPSCIGLEAYDISLKPHTSKQKLKSAKTTLSVISVNIMYNRYLAGIQQVFVGNFNGIDMFFQFWYFCVSPFFMHLKDMLINHWSIGRAWWVRCLRPHIFHLTHRILYVLPSHWSVLIKHCRL